MSGSIGEYTFKKNNVVSQRIRYRKPTRTQRTMAATLPLTNVMALYSVMKEQLMQCIEDCPNLGAASNFYMRHNVKRDTVWLTKSDKKSRASIVCEHRISEGTLPSLPQHLTDEAMLVTGIRLAADIDDQTTVGMLSRDMLAGNTCFRAGDNLKAIVLEQGVCSVTGVPQAYMYVADLILDAEDGRLVSELTRGHSWCRHEGCLALSAPLQGRAAAFVHRRPKPREGWQVSPQDLCCVNDLRNAYNTQEAYLAAVKSRGGFTDKSADAE